MRFVLFAVLGLLALAGAIVWNLPLSEITDRVAYDRARVDLGRVQGTWREGRVGPIFAGGRPVGVVELSWVPGRLMSAELSYDVRLDGPGLRGQGRLSRTIFGTKTTVNDLRVDLDIARFPGFVDRVRAAGGAMSLTAAEIVFDNDRCISAQGQAQTDVLTRASDVYGFVGPVLVGQLTCENDMLLVPMIGATPRGDDIRIEARFGGPEIASTIARVTTNDPELRNVLVLSGFMPEGPALIYRPDLGLR